MSLIDELRIDPQVETEKIVEFVQNQVEDLGRDGVTIGLSGGLDSSVCAYLCQKALDTNRISALILPEKDNDPLNMEHARLLAKNLRLPVKEIDHEILYPKP